MKNTDEFYDDINKNKQLINSKEKKGYVEYANYLVKNNSLVQMIGCHSFFLKSDLDTALESKGIETKSYPGLAPNGNSIGPAKVPIAVDCEIKIPEWVLEEYIIWKSSNTLDRKKARAFWATDTRIGIVIDKTNSEKEDYMKDYSRGEVVKVHWFENQDSHFTGTWSVSTDSFESVSFHHVRNLRDIVTDGPVERKIYACNFNEGQSSFY